MYNPYLYEKLANTHRQELLQEAKQQHLLVQMPRHHSQARQNSARRLAAFLMHLPLFSKKAGQPARMATGQL